MHYIFDMGNVLSRNVDVLPSIAGELGVSASDIVSFAGNDFDGLTVGAATPEEFWAAFNERFGTRVREDLLATHFRPVQDPRVEELIRTLQRRGSRVVCGTNTFAGHYRIHMEGGDYRVFDRVYASHLMGVAKPDPEFFRRILRAESWRPEEVTFVDDMAKNVEAAAGLGIHAILYRDYPELAARLLDNRG